MKRLLVAAVLLATSVAAFAAVDTQDVLVATRNPADRMAKTSDLEFVFTPEHRVTLFQSVNGFAATVTDEEIARLRKSPEVLWIEPVLERHALSDSITVGAQTTPYGVSMVNAPAVWQATRGKSADGTPVHVAIIDTGIDYNNPELKKVVKGGFNFLTGTSDPLDDEGHGTHVAGTIAAANDSLGVVGIASDVDIYSLKVLNQCGSGSTTNIITAIDWIIAKKAQVGGNWVINLSLGSPNPSALEEQAFHRAADAGILAVIASGNDYKSDGSVVGLAYPAAYGIGLSVGAIDAQKNVASFSQRGAELKLVAPGVSVLSTVVEASVKTDDGRVLSAVLPDAAKADGTKICLTTPTVSGNFVFAGFGDINEFPASVKGKIALVSRGNGIKFVDKTKNAKAAGAIGVVCYNNVEEGLVPSFEIAKESEVIPFVLISQADGEALKATPDAKVTLGFGHEDFALYNGTSMAAPHAAAVAALLWAIAPTAKASAIEQAMEQTATDLGDKGRDATYGFGLINALDAAKTLNPAAFGSGATPSASPVPSGRRATRRG